MCVLWLFIVFIVLAQTHSHSHSHNSTTRSVQVKVVTDPTMHTRVCVCVHVCVCLTSVSLLTNSWFWTNKTTCFIWKIKISNYFSRFFFLLSFNARFTSISFISMALCRTSLQRLLNLESFFFSFKTASINTYLVFIFVFLSAFRTICTLYTIFIIFYFIWIVVLRAKHRMKINEI